MVTAEYMASPISEDNMTTEAQKRASAKYFKKNVVQKVVRFGPHERDLLEHLESQKNMGGYIKSLIRDDMRGASKGR